MIRDAIIVLSGRSPLIAHKRLGQNGSELRALKFRTLCQYQIGPRLHEARAVEYIEEEPGRSRKKGNDPGGWSRFARFCRRDSLDELSQRLNGFQVSIVGPKTVTPPEAAEIYDSSAEEVLSTQPELSGLWQVSAPYRMSTEERCRLPGYARRRSMRRYLQILMRTLPELLTAQGSR